MRLLALVLVGASAAGSYAQLNVDSVLGNFDHGAGTNFRNGYLDGRFTNSAVSFSGTVEASWAATWPTSPYGSRGIVRFRSFGETEMASDNQGNTSWAVDGETRTFTTWNNAFAAEFGNRQYSFSAYADPFGVPSSSGDIGVQIDYIDMSSPNLNGSMVGGVSLGLDNSVYDLDPAVGKIMIDKYLTPTTSGLSSSYNDGIIDREQYWNGEFFQESPFWDSAFTTIQARVIMAGTEVANFGSDASGHLAIWTPGEDAIYGFSGNTLAHNYDFSTLDVGTYEIEAYAANWQHLGDEDTIDVTPWNTYPGTSSTSYAGSESTYELTIVNTVPEPGTMAVLAAGALALLRKRRRS